MDPKEKLSENLTLSEAIRSSTAKRLGISNLPTKEHLENLRAVAQNVFQPVREYVGGPLFVSSGYRSKEVNKATPRSSKTSRHLLGEALDLDADVFLSNGKTNADVFRFILENLDFDQLIWEYGTKTEPDWVHVSYSRTNNRNQVLRAVEIKGNPKYLSYNV